MFRINNKNILRKGEGQFAWEQSNDARDEPGATQTSTKARTQRDATSVRSNMVLIITTLVLS